MSSTAAWYATPTPTSRRARADTRGRRQNPARPAQPLPPTLRTSHFPDPPPLTLPTPQQDQLDQRGAEVLSQSRSGQSRASGGLAPGLPRAGHQSGGSPEAQVSNRVCVEVSRQAHDARDTRLATRVLLLLNTPRVPLACH